MSNAQVLYDSFGGAAGSFAGHVADSGQTWASTTGDNIGVCDITPSHQIRSNSAAQTVYYAGAMSDPKQEAIALLDVWSTGVTGAAAGVILAYTGAGSAQGNYYMGRYNQAASSNRFEIYLAQSTGYTKIASGDYLGAALPVGTGYIKFNVDVSAHTQALYYSTDGNTWTLICSATNSFVTVNGYSAFHIYGLMTDTTGVQLGLLSTTCGTFPNGGFAKVSGVGSTTATITGTAPTGGTANYSIQYQIAPDNSNAPGTWANVGSAQTGLTSGTAPSAYGVTGLSGLTSYWARQVVTDANSLTSYSAGVQFTTSVAPPAPTIYTDNANFVYSGRFAKSGSGSSARAVTITTGSRIEATISGTATCLIFADVSAITNSSYPEIVYTIDGYSQRVAFTSAGYITCTFPTWDTFITSAYGSHKLTIEAVGVYEGFGGSQGAQDQWNNLTCAFNFQGLQLDSGASLLPMAINPNWMEFLGDSDVASHDVLSGNSAHNQTQMASNVYWPRICADALGFRLSAVGYGKQGLVNNSAGNGGLASGNVPVATSTFGYVYNGVAYSPSIKPLVVVIEYGTNDLGITSNATFQSSYQTFLGTVRTAYPNAVIECLILPYFNAYATYVQAAITAFADSRTFIKNYGSGSVISVGAGDYQADGVHINVQGAAKLGAKLSLDIASDLTSLGIAMQACGGGTNILSLTITKPAGIPVLTWTADPSAVTYNVLRSPDNINFTKIATVTPPTVTYTDSAEPYGVVYYAITSNH